MRAEWIYGKCRKAQRGTTDHFVRPYDLFNGPIVRCTICGEALWGREVITEEDDPVELLLGT